MFMLNWLKAKKTTAGRSGSSRRGRRTFAQTTLPLISPRRGRRILRREQLFSVVRESMIRGGVLSTSYEFKTIDEAKPSPLAQQLSYLQQLISAGKLIIQVYMSTF